jgi:hypothetical protein
MTTLNKFALMTGLPEYGERAYVDNVNIGDVITYRVNGVWIFSAVIGTTPSMIKVVDLICEIDTNQVTLYKNNNKNTTTNCRLKTTRRIFKVRNVNKL